MKKSESEILKVFKVLAKKLQKLIRKNKDESEEGEVLRAKMDKLWMEIPESARRKINKNIKLPKI